ncbi:hypothetical protein [Mucilaginibacter ginsenosidivorax]|uniref:Uncharacterized protein n=1 Tax=Mucilaginibacter ginsenosidivorax TaxID=862126 RepID=A0A5B8W0I6_9SPHI|nr:hypothetical protein [Mucilaginibacter ginsenosidivorax]QEC76405.1 hypothetical protein FSB76_10770 [Mucilaginibacter ginsenosidivorax]
MKKTLLIIILATCISQLKAQISLNPFFNNKITWSPTLKPKTATTFFATQPVTPQLKDLLSGNVQRVPDAQPMRYLMPVVKVSGTDRMPIVKTDEPGMHYTMLIKGYGSPKLDSLANSTP